MMSQCCCGVSQVALAWLHPQHAKIKWNHMLYTWGYLQCQLRPLFLNLYIRKNNVGLKTCLLKQISNFVVYLPKQPNFQTVSYTIITDPNKIGDLILFSTDLPTQIVCGRIGCELHLGMC